MAEAERQDAAVRRATASRETGVAELAALTERLESAQRATDLTEADPGERDRLALEAARMRQAEMEARLALRTDEERARALAGRAEALLRAARTERAAREQAAAKRERLLPRGEKRRPGRGRGVRVVARGRRDVPGAGRSERRKAADERRVEADRRVHDARQRSRDLGPPVRGDRRRRPPRRTGARRAAHAHRASLAEKALAELGLEARCSPPSTAPTSSSRC
jgi:chromosome segregation protein